MSEPVVPGFHPDPSVCRVGADYYLACSSFEYFPGIPLFHSRDLVHWTPIGNALDRPEQLRLPAGTPSSGGLYAPTLRHHDGRFWLIVTNVSDGGNLLFHTTDPAGPWSDPTPLPDVRGIDPDIAWDAEGRCWCTTAGGHQVEIDPHTGKTLGRPYRVWSGSPGAQAPEAPHLFRIGEFWYLLIAEGGTERGHSVAIARGPSPAGPFEPCPANPILTHRGLEHPVQNTGHADLVQAPDGEWWMVFLGARPRGGSPGWHVLGRETFLAPVRWADGWPIVGDIKDGAGSGNPGWISLRHRPPDRYLTTERPGWVTLVGAGSLDDLDVTFLGRRQQQFACRVRTRIDAADGVGGLTVRLDERHHYEVEVTAGRVEARARIGPLSTVLATRDVPEGPVEAWIEFAPTTPRDPRDGPDTVHLGISESAGDHTLAELDGRYLSTEVAGGFTGRVIGMYATAGRVHFNWLG
jgi:beta-xylosidase